ncbi:AAA family ATPase [uncultured Dubosiella sp.]|uniref:AAA family ATPase n=1 Tax=uncultured Dubosiella sp. TaxID=1937011 RepID=UPI0027306B74|nr:AAA family ATPase [uncultured Dubosiella sp.]
MNCDNNPLVKDIFYDFDIGRLIRSFSAITNIRIEKEKTLIVLDEIQEYPLGLTALKYFCENAPEYHIVVAGSLLGFHVHQGTGFPVGKVDQIHMYPMSFEEFLLAMDQTILLETMKRRR